MENRNYPKYVSAIGQDSHRFTAETEGKPLKLGGVVIDGAPGLDGNSDADVILHALTNAISGLTGIPVLGAAADTICAAGNTDSAAYLAVALEDLAATPWQLTFVSFTIQAKRPKLLGEFPRISASVADLLGLPEHCVTMTATTGEGLTACGRGEGIEVFCIVSAVAP